MWIKLLRTVAKVAIVVGLDKKIKGWVVGRIDGVRDKLYQKLNETEEIVDLVDPWDPPTEETLEKIFGKKDNEDPKEGPSE